MSDFTAAPDTRILSPGRRGEEIWESLVEGRTWVEVHDYTGRPRSTSVQGVGQRLRITADDRVRAQERIREAKFDPFVNGTLRRIDQPQATDPTTASKDALSEDDLKLIFGLDLDDFKETVTDLSEVPIRRLKAMAPVHASMQQGQFLDELIQERYAVGGTTPTYEEMQADPSGGSRLS